MVDVQILLGRVSSYGLATYRKLNKKDDLQSAFSLVAGVGFEPVTCWPRPRALRRLHWSLARCGLPGRRCFSQVRIATFSLPSKKPGDAGPFAW